MGFLFVGFTREIQIRAVSRCRPGMRPPGEAGMLDDPAGRVKAASVAAIRTVPHPFIPVATIFGGFPVRAGKERGVPRRR